MTKKPTFLAVHEARQAFTEAVSDLEERGLHNEIRNLSQALGILRHAGIDVDFAVSGWPGDDSYLGLKNCTSNLTGILRIGNNEHVLSLITDDEDEDEDQTYWALSHSNICLGMADEDNPATFNVDDRDCYQTLQRRIIDLAVENKFIADNDISGAFNHSPRREARIQLSKPVIAPAKVSK